MIAASAAKDADTVNAYVSAFADAGCGELVMTPTSGDPAQVGAASPRRWVASVAPARDLEPSKSGS